ncbi:MAG: hypothetical protein P8166_06845, partial [Candidatus Thiodiazotropha sp.]
MKNQFARGCLSIFQKNLIRIKSFNARERDDCAVHVAFDGGLSLSRCSNPLRSGQIPGLDSEVRARAFLRCLMTLSEGSAAVVGLSGFRVTGEPFGIIALRRS